MFNINKSQLSSNFISNRLQVFNQGFDVDPDMRMLGYVHHVGDVRDVNSPCDYDDEDSIIQKKFDIFNKVEGAGSKISCYRCVYCRGCNTFKNHSHEIISIKEETEQENNSVNVDTTNHQPVATLPLIS